jgi:tetratricopeptide (TPR) repeat protein
MDKKLPARRAMGKTMSDLGRLLEGKNFKSFKEVNKYLKKVMSKGGIPPAPPKSALELAQDIMYDAWEAENRRERIKMAKEALSISPDCADAYVLLAEEAASLEEAKEFYQKGVEAGERALGKETFKKNTGHFWGIIKTRPYMRAREGLIQTLWALGECDEAIKHCQEMLKLNPNDNQGIRYLLVGYLAESGRYDELQKHLYSKRYKDDGAAVWCYTKALLSFIKEGPSPKANRLLRVALECNLHVPKYLTGKKKLSKTPPPYITPGGEDEAYSYALDLLPTWKKVPGAIEWLKEQTKS